MYIYLLSLCSGEEKDEFNEVQIVFNGGSLK